MASISRGAKAAGGTAFQDNTTAYGSEVETDFDTIYSAWNSHNSGGSTWTAVTASTITATNAVSVPLIATNGAGTNNILEARDNATAVLTVADGGVSTFAPGGTTKAVVNSSGITLSNSATLAMGSAKITGLANGTTTTDGAAYGQLRILQVVTGTSTAQTDNTSSAAFTDTGLTVSITPATTTNKILVIVSGQFGMSAAGENAHVTLNRSGNDLGNSTNGMLVGVSGAGSFRQSAAMAILDSPSTTSAVTYTVAIRRGGASGTASWNDTAIRSTITALEVLA
jgi:hypothetical protein